MASVINGQMRPESAATVFIVDDDEGIRESISFLVRSIGLANESYATAQQFLDSFGPHKPGCLVLDLHMPGMSGLELQRTLSANLIAPPIIFLTAYGDIPVAIEAIRGGAVDFIQKPFRSEALLERIREALRIDAENRRQRALVADFQERAARLTGREREIMELLARGDSTKRIARELSISPKTVDNHRGKILEKMQVENTTQLARLNPEAKFTPDAESSPKG